MVKQWFLSLTYNNMPPPLLFRSSLWGTEKPFIKNWIGWKIHGTSMHLREFSRWYFPQVQLVFNLGVHCIICVKLMYFPKTFHLNYGFKVNYDFQYLKCFNFAENDQFNSPNLHRLFWNKLAKNVLKNSVEFMSKSNFFLNKCTETCWSHLNWPNRQFFLIFRWNK